MKRSQQNMKISGLSWLQCIYYSPSPRSSFWFKAKLPGRPVVNVLIQTKYARLYFHLDGRLSLIHHLRVPNQTNSSDVNSNQSCSSRNIVKRLITSILAHSDNQGRKGCKITKGASATWCTYLNQLYKGFQIHCRLPINLDDPLERIEVISRFYH